MKKTKNFFIKYKAQAQVAALILILAGIFLAGYFEVKNLSRQIASIKEEMASSTASLNGIVAALQGELNAVFEYAKKENAGLASALKAEQEKSRTIENKVSGIAGTVGTLEKLSKTDRELLQKYSKVYFLNENYVPLHLLQIDQKYLSNKNGTQEFHSNALPYLKRMLDDSVLSGNPILVVSAYRSFGSQKSLKAANLITYGAGANKFVADQGYSEHQLGTTVDLDGEDFNSLLEINFENTRAFKWLKENAYKYGFVLSYPEGNAYYQYEPWHWRFVGVKLATKLHNENKNFYDLDQREIDTYLISIFD